DLDAVGIVDVIRLEEAQPVGLAGLDDVEQALSGKSIVADEYDLGDAGLGSLVDLEDEVDAAVRQIDDLGHDAHVVTAAALIDLEDALDVRLDDGLRVGAARFRLHLLVQLLVFRLLVAFEGHPVDHRIFDHRHEQTVGPGGDSDVLEQPCGIKSLQGLIDLGGVEPLTGADAEIGPDGVGFDAAVALDIDSQNLRNGDAGRPDRGDDRAKNGHAEQGKSYP